MREMATQLVTVADYRAAVAETVAARPERAWALACLALETAVRLIPHLQPHAALLSPLSAPVVAEYGRQIADASQIAEVKIIARWAGRTAEIAHTIHGGASENIGCDGKGMAELAAGILQHVDGCAELESWVRVLAATLADEAEQGD
jgi:hypothetical protein